MGLGIASGFSFLDFSQGICAGSYRLGFQRFQGKGGGHFAGDDAFDVVLEVHGFCLVGCCSPDGDFFRDLGQCKGRSWAVFAGRTGVCRRRDLRDKPWHGHQQDGQDDEDQKGGLYERLAEKSLQEKQDLPEYGICFSQGPAGVFPIGSSMAFSSVHEMAS